MAHCQQTAQKAPGNGHEQAEGFHHRCDFGFGKTDIFKKDIGNHPQHNVGYPVKPHKYQQEQCKAGAVSLEEIEYRFNVALVHQLLFVERGQPE